MNFNSTLDVIATEMAALPSKQSINMMIAIPWRDRQLFHVLSLIRCDKAERCYSVEFYDTECEFDWECPGGHRCENGVCVPRT